MEVDATPVGGGDVSMGATLVASHDDTAKALVEPGISRGVSTATTIPATEDELRAFMVLCLEDLEVIRCNLFLQRLLIIMCVMIMSTLLILFVLGYTATNFYTCGAPIALVPAIPASRSATAGIPGNHQRKKNVLGQV